MRQFIRLAASAALIFASASASAQTVPVESVTITVTSAKLAVGGSRTYKATVLPANATEQTITWTSSNPEVASIDAASGKLVGLYPGTTTITAACGGKSASLDVAISLKNAAVGQYLFSDGSWQQSGIVAGKTCVGVIFYLDEDKRGGKAVSLDEAPQLKWSLAEAANPDAMSALDGEANLRSIMAVDGWESIFDAEKWCYDKSTDKLEWYLPAVDELRQLFAASCGLTWVESGANEANKEINNWTGASVTMVEKDGQPDIDPYPTEREAFNKKFTSVGATALAADKYWSSTQLNDQMTQFLSFEGGYSNAQPKQYFHVCRTRAIVHFREPEAITTGVETITGDAAGDIEISAAGGVVTVRAAEPVTAVEVYAADGRLLMRKVNTGAAETALYLDGVSAGTVCVVRAATASASSSAKFVR